jgi:hypothetical protein
MRTGRNFPSESGRTGASAFAFGISTRRIRSNNSPFTWRQDTRQDANSRHGHNRRPPTRRPGPARTRVFAGIVHRLCPLREFAATLERSEVGDRVVTPFLFDLRTYVDAASRADQELGGFARTSASNDCAPVLRNKVHRTLRIGCGNRTMFAAKAALAGARGEFRRRPSRSQRPAQVPTVTAPMMFV